LLAAKPALRSATDRQGRNLLHIACSGRYTATTSFAEAGQTLCVGTRLRVVRRGAALPGVNDCAPQPDGPLVVI
jgi:hypothetical protein